MRKAALGAIVVMLVGAAATAGGRREYSDEQLVALLAPDRPSDQAILAAREAVAGDPTSAQFQIDLGNAYRAASFLPEARGAFREATRLDPDNSISWYNLGVMQNFDGNPGAAKGSFRRAIRADPRNAEARYNLAQLLFEDRDYDAAVTEMKAALLLRPELADSHENPRASQSKLVLPSRIALYSDTFGGNTLAPRKTADATQLADAVDSRWLGIDHKAVLAARAAAAKAAAENNPGGAETNDEARDAASATGEPDEPDGRTTPIVLGPGSVDPRSGSGDGAAADDRGTARPRPGQGTRRIRAGGPLPPRPRRD